MRYVVGVIAASLLVAGTITWAADKEKEVDLSTIKCVVSGKKINPEATADYKGAKVYFCCEGCPTAFAKDTKKFASKANMQLVATHQAKQESCPFSGKKLDPATAVKVADVNVCFCCANCQKKVAEAKGDAQIDLVFADAPFEKGFKVAKK